MYVTLYTDGSCLGNPGPGAWCYFIFKSKDYHDSPTVDSPLSPVTGSAKETTNNRMELLAVINGLMKTLPSDNVRIFTDSQYVVKSAVGQQRIIKNKDLWEKYFRLAKGKRVEFVWVKGHNGNHYNELADSHARKAATKIRDFWNAQKTAAKSR